LTGMRREVAEKDQLGAAAARDCVNRVVVRRGSSLRVDMAIRMDTGALISAIAFLILLGTGLWLVRAARFARLPAKAEHGLAPHYCEQAGGRFDGMNWTIPFVRIATFDGFVSISCITHQAILKAGDVTKIDRRRHFFSVGLRLHHHRSDLPATIVLWPRDTPRLEAALRASLLS
jgi:hypothetical protein